MAKLILNDGTSFDGTPFGYNDNTVGEIVFQTGMVGYVQSLTDPSYLGQLLVLTYPLVGNYGVPDYSRDEDGILKNFESEKIHTAGLVVSSLCEEGYHSHYEAVESLNNWLKRNKITGIQGVDTRALTKHLRVSGCMLAKIVIEGKQDFNFPLEFPILVSNVAIKSPKFYKSRKNSIGIQIIAVDCGIKNNQIRYLLSLGMNIKLVPPDYDFKNEIKSKSFHGLYLSNGPGNPEDCKILIENISYLLNENINCPIMGVCLGHQILGLSAGFETSKMRYGHRGHNQPCKDTIIGRCYVTSQNHGFMVNFNNSNINWKELFVNINDSTNEGIYHSSLPYMSVQFHPEHASGPKGTEFLFKLFYNMVSDYFNNKNVSTVDHYYKSILSADAGLPLPYSLTDIHPRNKRRILVLGSGGLSIGQAGEFDYSGSQCLKALKEEGMHVILINSNVATVQTVRGLADSVYFLPVTLEYVEKVIDTERPDSIILSVGGQTALNCGLELYKNKVLEKYNVQVLGTSVESIEMTEDRFIFASKMAEINEEVPPNVCVSSEEEAIEAVKSLGYPVLVRSAFSLGGSGSGYADNEQAFRELVVCSLSNSKQVIIDKFLRGWKEIEFEILRDSNNDSIAVCDMENIDPVGIHTGESVVVAPSQTLNDNEYNTLRATSLKVAKYLNIVGECNIQFAVSPESGKYYIIELNARLSRSSALASKATGYPLAYISTKVSLGHHLANLKNVTTSDASKSIWTSACFEPSLDYVVIKIPRWDLDKFINIDTSIGTSMKSIGEVMAIGRNFSECLQKALRMVHEDVLGVSPERGSLDLNTLIQPSNKRINGIARALYIGHTAEEICNLSFIDRWFLYQIKKIVDIIKSIEKIAKTTDIDKVSVTQLKFWKCHGFSDKQIGYYFKCHQAIVQRIRHTLNIVPFVKQIDTVAAEYPATTNYLYLTYNAVESDVEFNTVGSVLVIGSGAYRIGSSVEFDCCSVCCVRELKKMNKPTIMLNCNPETVSTDFDECDRMYFDEISAEIVYDIYKLENPDGVIISMGGQSPNNIANILNSFEVNILGTSSAMIDTAENRFKFSRLLDQLKICQPRWKELTTTKAAIEFCHEVEYPCLVRPSYVLSGAAMNVAHSDQDLEKYLTCATELNTEHPVVVSKFMVDSIEIDVDAVSLKGKMICFSVAEHIEKAGVHSGDASLIIPTISISEEVMNNIYKICSEISMALYISGPFNLQLILKNEQLYVIECNLRVSRSFPFSSKAHNVDFLSAATQAILGNSSFTFIQKISKSVKKYAVKIAKFSFRQLRGADVISGVEMHSTGEVACFGTSPQLAFLKALHSVGFRLPTKNCYLSFKSYKVKSTLEKYVRSLENMGYKLFGDPETSEYYSECGIDIKTIDLSVSSSSILDNDLLIKCFIKNNIELIVFITPDCNFNTEKNNKNTYRGYLIRRFAVDFSISLICDQNYFAFLVESLPYSKDVLNISKKIDSISSSNLIKLPYLIDCHVHMREPGASHKEDYYSGTVAALSGGISCVLCMPNTNPPIINETSYEVVKNFAASKSVCDYGFIAGAGSKANGSHHSFLSKNCAALKLYLNDTYGNLKLDGIDDWMYHFQQWPDNIPIMVHAEEVTLAAVIYIASMLKKKIHICHVSKKSEIELIKHAKLQGISITCEVSPHHLFLTSDYIDVLGSKRIKVKPELGGEKDRQALWDNLEYIDCFATDHAPHLLSEKDSEFPPPGFPGIETMLPLLLNSVNEKKLTLNDIILRLHTNPMKIFDIPPQPDSCVIVDMNEKWNVKGSSLYSKSKWTPFENFTLRGCVERVIIRGKTVFVGGKIMAKPGFGLNLFYNKHVSSPLTENLTERSISCFDIAPPIVEITEPEYSLYDMIISNESSNWLYKRHFVSVAECEKGRLGYLFNLARELKSMKYRGKYHKMLKGKVLALAFFEPSTRTMLSFQSAIQRLGGTSLVLKPSDCSLAKGETYEDTIKALASFADAIVVRHNLKGLVHLATTLTSCPIINAGDGTGEHPTQALLDIFTIREEIGTINGLTISMVGDLLNGRTIHSLAKLLCVFKNVKINYVSPKGLEMPYDIQEQLTQHQVIQTHFTKLEDIICQSDVIYMTRIQKERFTSHEEYLKCNGQYVLTPELMTLAKNKMIVMHPLPRIDEIDKSLDLDPRCVYFKQMEYGMYIRMALLLAILCPRKE